MKRFFVIAIIVVLMLSSRKDSQAQNWLLAGNNGTNPPTNFLGTKDSKALVFKTNNKERMRLSSGGNLGVGTASPVYKLDVNGDINLSIGSVIRNNGSTVLKDDSSLNNVFVGDRAGRSNTNGNANTVIGSRALFSNTVGRENTATGYGVLFANVSGEHNTADGMDALTSNIDGSFNTAEGFDALFSNTSGIDNTASGDEALFSTTSGLNNTATGDQAGFNVTDGSDNTFIGALTNCGSAGHILNATALGNGATVTSNNHVRVGNSSVTSIGGFVNWSNISDGRVKMNIKQNVPGLAFINKLLPITYNLNLDAADNIIQAPARINKDGKTIAPSQAESDARKAKEEIVYTGFVAQDVEKAAKEVGYDFSGVDAPQNDYDLYGLRYSDFVVPLVKAVQELSAKNDAKDLTIAQMKNQIADMQNEIDQLKNTNIANAGMVKSGITDSKSFLLGQNIPNPFNHSTLIPFRIPDDCHDASIAITETATGKIARLIPVSCTETQLSVDAGSLASGNYSYSLYVDGKLVETKQMILDK